MKNKTLFIGFLMVVLIAITSCAGNRSGYQGNHRKGYGCPSAAY